MSFQTLRTILLVCSLPLTAIMATGAHAATYSATLSGANERPTPNASTATGLGSLTLSSDSNSFSVNISFSGLTAAAAAGHIHCCNTTAGNGPVAVGFSVPAATSGTITGFFDLTKAATYSAGFFNGLGGGTVGGARTAFLNGLGTSRAYFNVHNSVFPGGEIRGQLIQTAVPEPASWALLIGGFGLTGAVMRRRRDLVLPA